MTIVRLGWMCGVMVWGVAGAAMARDPLPQGDAGIAAAYPNDADIGSDPEVIFADDFENHGSVDALWDRWDAVHHLDQLRLATEPENVWAGDQALEMTVPQQDNELSNAVQKVVAPELDVLFLRYYSRFDSPFDVVGSSHNGAMISAHYYIDGQATPGVPADGTNKFLAALENWRGQPDTESPGMLNIYLYHPEQRSEWGDHFFPSGTVLPNSSLPFDFGPQFVPREDIVPQLDRWYCWEFMVQANTPGQLDGRIAIWLDGELAADFHNLRLRDVPELTIDRFGLSFHIGSNPNGMTRKWYDNVVAARSYIGPMATPGGAETGGPGDTGEVDGTGGGTGGGSAGTTGGADAGDDAADTSAAAETTGGDAQDDEGDAGCGCRSSRGPGGTGLVVILGLWGLARRRPAEA